MTDQDRAILAIAGEQWSHDGRREAKARAIGLSVTQVMQRANVLIEDPEVIAELPALTARLRRLRDRRLAARKVRAL